MLITFIVFAVGALIFTGFSAAIIYHFLKYGFIGDATKIMALIYLVVAALILFFGFRYFLSSGLSWSFGSPDQKNNLPVLGR